MKLFFTGIVWSYYTGNIIFNHQCVQLLKVCGVGLLLSANTVPIMIEPLPTKIDFLEGPFWKTASFILLESRIAISWLSSFLLGPGQYELKDGSTRGGLMTTRQQRFKQIKNENPGPGSYEVIPAFVKGRIIHSTYSLNRTLFQRTGKTLTVQTWNTKTTRIV